MTLAVAFIRTLPDRQRRRQELVFASDSRLTWGQRLDDGQKIFGLARTDALLAFAGDTKYAYPLAHHLVASVQMYPRSIDRRYPLHAVKGQLLRIYNQIYRGIYGMPVGRETPIDDEPRVQFLFGGYVWHDDQFRIWRIVLDRRRQEFVFERCRGFAFIGNDDAARDAARQTALLLWGRDKTRRNIDLEPLEVLMDVVATDRHPYVGGAPQIAKVYRHMNTQFFATVWPRSGGSEPPARHVFGRALAPNEVCSWPIFDARTLRFEPGVRHDRPSDSDVDDPGAGHDQAGTPVPEEPTL